MVHSLGRRSFIGGLAGLTGALVLNACGDDDGDDSGADTTTGGTAGSDTTATTASGGSASAPSGEMTTAQLGLLPITDVAPFYLGQSLGYFSDRNLTVEPNFAAGGAVILPSVESGEFDIGYSNIVSLLLLQSRGGAYKLLAGGGKTASGDEDDYSQMFVLEDSDIESMADLGGKTVAINTPKNALEIVTRESVEQAGGDHESINFVEFPFPEMGGALRSGTVDAILYNEPFQTLMLQEGGVRILGRPFNDAVPGEILAYYFVKADQVDGPIATAFAEGMRQANAYASENPQAVRDIIPTYTEVAPELAAELVMPPYVEESVPESSIARYAELMTKFGLVDEMPDYAAMLP